MPMPLIEARGVSLTYPIYSIRAQSLRNSVINLAVGGRLIRDRRDIVQVTALDRVSFSVAPGDRIGVMGPNGSGKTTLLKILAGVYEPTGGAIQLNGSTSSMLDISLGMDHEATGLENIATMGRMRGWSPRVIKQKIPEIEAFSELGAYLRLPLKTYSAGMSMRLVFGLATCMDPDILLLDEWLSAGDEHFVDKAKARMTELVERSRCVMLATHSWQLVSDVCTKLLILDAGRVHYFGPVDEEPFHRVYTHRGL